MDHEHFMTKALQQAEAALDAGEFPVGSVMVHKDRIIATGARKGSTGDCPNEVDHAEMVALKRLISLKSNINFREVTLYSTLEPCLMCFGALIISDIGKIVFAYEDAMGGGTQCDFTKLPPLYKEKQIAVVPNILRQKSLQLLKVFFSNPGNTYLKGTLLSEYTLCQ